MSEETKEKLKNLAVIREEIASAKTDAKHAQANLEATIEYEVLRASKDHLKELETEAEDLIIEIKSDEHDAIEWGEDGEFEKPTTPGIGARAKHTILFDDATAKGWCIKNAIHYLIIDKPVFTKAALDANKGKNAKQFPCVTYVDDVEITIASDLSYYLEEK